MAKLLAVCHRTSIGAARPCTPASGTIRFRDAARPGGLTSRETDREILPAIIGVPFWKTYDDSGRTVTLPGHGDLLGADLTGVGVQRMRLRNRTNKPRSRPNQPRPTLKIGLPQLPASTSCR
jgi:hypothetical protein